MRNTAPQRHKIKEIVAVAIETLSKAPKPPKQVFVIIDTMCGKIYGVTRSLAKAEKRILAIRMDDLIDTYPLGRLRNALRAKQLDDVDARLAVTNRCKTLRRMGYIGVNENNLTSFQVAKDTESAKLKKLAKLFIDIDGLTCISTTMI